MHQEGHYGAALVAYMPLGAVTLLADAAGLAIAGGVASLALAMVPDWDMKAPALEHRGVTHTIWFALIVGVAGSSIGVYVGNLRGGMLTILAVGLFGLGVGFVAIASHIVADALTPMGVTPFSPFNDRRYSLDVTNSDSTVANYALLVFGVAAVGGLIMLWRVVQ